MKNFTAPEMEFIAFEIEDVITSSPVQNDITQNSDGSVGLPWG